MAEAEMVGTTEVDFSDLYKIRDALEAAVRHHKLRDESNAVLHLGTTRYSPLTSQLLASQERLEWYLKPVGGAV
jgi:hypothetical protein